MHTATRIYIDASTPTPDGITLPFDVADVLHRGTDDVGQLYGDVDEHGNRVYITNKWAKYKAVKNEGMDYTSQLNADYTWKDSADWWKGSDGQCGLTFETAESLYTGNNPFASGSFLRKLKDGELPWGYDPPTGRMNVDPFRIFDFNQYDHAAPEPVTGVFDNLRLYDSGKLTVQLDETRAEDNLGIQLSDLTIGNSDVKDWFVGVLIYMSDTVGEYTFAFSENTIGSGDLSVQFANMSSYGGRRVTIVPFLSSVRDDQGVNPGAGVFLSCDIDPKTVLIRSEEQGVVTTIDAQWRDPFHVRVGYVVNIINNRDAQLVVDDLVVALYDERQNVDTDPFDDFTIQARSNKECKGVLIANPYYQDATYTVIVTSRTQGVSGSVRVEPYR